MTDVIREMPVDDRPRERLLKHGPTTLSNAELVSLLLGSGRRGRNAIQLARDLLADGVNALSATDAADLLKVSGMGGAKVARVIAAFELGQRARTEQIAEVEPPRFDATEFGTTLLRRMQKYPQERLGAALLDGQHRIIAERELFIGTINNALVSTRDVIAYVLQHNAVGVVLYHNHPSGEPKPSNDDIQFTKRMKQSLGLCDIELVDHLIIGKHRFTMLSATGTM